MNIFSNCGNTFIFNFHSCCQYHTIYDDTRKPLPRPHFPFLFLCHLHSFVAFAFALSKQCACCASGMGSTEQNIYPICVYHSTRSIMVVVATKKQKTPAPHDHMMPCVRLFFGLFPFISSVISLLLLLFSWITDYRPSALLPAASGGGTCKNTRL